MDAIHFFIADQLAAQSIPVLQGLIIILGTFILEDPTTVLTGLLVAENKITFQTAFLALSFGIALGDVGLFYLGRYAKNKWNVLKKVSPGKLSRAKEMLAKNIVAAVVLSRFVPGMRLPTYVAAGLTDLSASFFLGLVLTLSLAWTFLLLNLTAHFGAVAFQKLGTYAWPVLLIFFGGIFLTQYLMGRRKSSS